LRNCFLQVLAAATGFTLADILCRSTQGSDAITPKDIKEFVVPGSEVVVAISWHKALALLGRDEFKGLNLPDKIFVREIDASKGLWHARDGPAEGFTKLSELESEPQGWVGADDESDALKQMVAQAGDNEQLSLSLTDYPEFATLDELLQAASIAAHREKKVINIEGRQDKYQRAAVRFFDRPFSLDGREDMFLGLAEVLSRQRKVDFYDAKRGKWIQFFQLHLLQQNELKEDILTWDHL